MVPSGDGFIYVEDEVNALVWRIECSGGCNGNGQASKLSNLTRDAARRPAMGPSSAMGALHREHCRDRSLDARGVGHRVQPRWSPAVAACTEAVPSRGRVDIAVDSIAAARALAGVSPIDYEIAPGIRHHASPATSSYHHRVTRSTRFWPPCGHVGTCGLDNSDAACLVGELKPPRRRSPSRSSPRRRWRRASGRPRSPARRA